jgi:hypothetical protein
MRAGCGKRVLFAQSAWVVLDLNPAIWETIAAAGGRTDGSRLSGKKQIPRFARNDKLVETSEHAEAQASAAISFRESEAAEMA